MDDGGIVLFLDAPVVRDPGLCVFAELDRAVAVGRLGGDDFHDELHGFGGVPGAVGVVGQIRQQEVRLGAVPGIERIVISRSTSTRRA